MPRPDLFAGVLPFVHTAQERSFGRAARQLGVTSAAISKAVARLEEELGVRLFNRTTRSVSLTVEGEQLLEHYREAVARIQGGRELVAQSRRMPRGELSMTLSPILGRLVVPELTRLLARHPALTLRLHLSDRHARVVDENIDVAVRIGELTDSALQVRRLRTTRWVTLAAPSYLARRGVPLTPQALPQHDCLKFLSPSGRPREWSFCLSAGQAPQVVRTPGRATMDSGELLLEAASSGMGICQALDFMVGGAVREGRLVEVLQPFAASGPPIQALYAPGRQGTPNVRACLDFLVELFHGPAPGGPSRAIEKSR
jgi:LysR family transcriptional regulator for bpeEF and oprC